MANDTYSAGSGQGIYAGRFSNTQLSDFIAAMPSNSWAEYAGTNINQMLPRDFDGDLMGIFESAPNYPITNWANKFAWHPSRRIISGVGTSQGFTIAGGEVYSKQVVFNLALNSFSVKWSPTGQVQGHIYDHNCSNFVNDKTWRKPSTSGQMAVYDAATNEWSLSYSLNGLSDLGSFWGIECSAEHNALFCIESTSGRLVKFDLTTGTRTVVGSYTGVGVYPVIVKIGSYVVFGGGAATGTSFYKIDTSGNVTLLTDSIPVRYSASGNYRFLPHPTLQNSIICFSKEDMRMRLLNISTGMFSDIGTLPSNPEMEYSVSASLIGLGAIATFRGAGRSGGATISKFWVYKV